MTDKGFCEVAAELKYIRGLLLICRFQNWKIASNYFNRDLFRSCLHINNQCPGYLSILLFDPFE